MSFTEDDVLVIAGDAVDRGPKSLEVVKFIADSPNVHCIRGNHEDMVIDMIKFGGQFAYLAVLNGAHWALDLNKEDERFILDEMESWPDVIEVNKGGKRFGVLHAEPDCDDWNKIGSESRSQLLWGRHRVRELEEPNIIANVDQIFCGHTILKTPKQTGNVLHMDLGCYHTGKLHHVEL